MTKIIEEKICTECQKSFQITQEDITFLDKMLPRFWQDVYQFPLPKSCPDCRQQKRLSFFNERSLYKRQSDISWKTIISVYSPDKNIKVYDQKEWWGDTFSGISFWRLYKAEKDFFEQFGTLLQEVPSIALVQVNCENSEFNNYLDNSQNCYLSISSQESQDCQYVAASIKIKKSLDCWWSSDIQNSYEIFNCGNIYHSFFSSGCIDCADMYFSEECYNCSHCLFCYGLYNKKYHIFNKEYTEEEYKKRLAELQLFSYEGIKKYENLFADFVKKIVHKYAHEERNENCTGDYIYNCKNARNSFSVVEVENTLYLYEWGRVKTVYDSTNIYDGQGNTVGSITVNYGTNVYFSFDIYNSSDIFYSRHLYNCKFCFGCVGLKNQAYCILNKQYSREEYMNLVPQIINTMIEKGQWGEFFPKHISPFGYNETVAQEYFPLTKEEALKKWYHWSDYVAPQPKVDKIIPWAKLPGSIESIPDDVLNWAIECEITKRPFRINSVELAFYRTHNLPLPRRHPDQRHLDRIMSRNPRILYERSCYNCQKIIPSTYSPEREEHIFCETCYKEATF
jgi:hypothetical protein